MAKIGHGLFPRSDCEALGHRAISESGNLREDKPHPVALLLAAAQFAYDPRVDWPLRIKEALKIEGVRHGALLPGWVTSAASRSRSGRWPSRIFCMGGWQVEPLGAIYLRKTLHPSAFRRPFDFESVASYGLDVDIAFDGECHHPLAATLANLAEQIQQPQEGEAGFLHELAARSSAASSPSSISPLGIDHAPSSFLRQ